MIFFLWEILWEKGGGKVERFACRTQIVSGADALSGLKEIPGRKMLLVTQPHLIQNGQVESLRKAAQKPETLFWEFPGQFPTMKQAVEGSRKLKEFSPDLVIALGDSSTLDLGKAMTCFSGVHCLLAVVPAAICCGQETTDHVTLCHNGRMHLLRDRQMCPGLALLDSRMAADISRTETREHGFALLSAALESYACAGYGSLSAIHAREAFVSAWASLPAAFTGNPGACSRMQTASVLSGMAMTQTGLGLCRAMENSLGAVLSLSRGKASAIVLPAIIGCNAHAAGSRYAALSRAAGLGGSRDDIGIRNLKIGLIRLRRELGLAETLMQAGLNLRDIRNHSRQIVELTLEDPACRNNPVAVDDFMVRRILEEITGRI